MAKKDIRTIGHETRFSKDRQPANSGRKPSRIKAYVQQNDLCQTDIVEMIKELVELDEAEMRAKMMDPSQPMLIRGFCRAFMEDMKKGCLANMETLLTRAFGAPKQTIDTNVNQVVHINKPDFIEEK